MSELNYLLSKYNTGNCTFYERSKIVSLLNKRAKDKKKAEKKQRMERERAWREEFKETKRRKKEIEIILKAIDAPLEYKLDDKYCTQVNYMINKGYNKLKRRKISIISNGWRMSWLLDKTSLNKKMKPKFFSQL